MITLNKISYERKFTILGDGMSKQLERLQKVIARSGIASRRKAEQLIIDGKVKVNQKVVTELGFKVSATDEVAVNNLPLEKEKLVYYLLYKPRGYITSVSDDRNRKTVLDLMNNIPERIFPVGRLDYHSSGLLLLTNDGEFAHQLMHPKFELNKTYIAKIKGVPSKEKLAVILKGVRDGKDLLKVTHFKVKQIDRRKQTMIVEVSLHEGRNRHIRRMFEQLGHPVLKLSREKYGFLTLDKLTPGNYRPLTRQEVVELRQLASQNVKQ